LLTVKKSWIVAGTLTTHPPQLDGHITNQTMSLIHRPPSPQPQQQTSNVNGIVLDALPYVEALDPHYEQQAISLIEAELSNAMYDDEHPSLQRKLLSTSTTDTNEFLKNSPLAAHAYQSLLQRQESGRPAESVEWTHQTPFGGQLTNDTSSQDLQTSIASSKIVLEHHRIHLANLELQAALSTPNAHQSHHSVLENAYVLPASKLVAEQRVRVDGINASRMEEQRESLGKLITLRQKWDRLVDKNMRLERAIEGLQNEVQGLQKATVEGREIEGDNHIMVGGTGSKES